MPNRYCIEALTCTVSLVEQCIKIKVYRNIRFKFVDVFNILNVGICIKNRFNYTGLSLG